MSTEDVVGKSESENANGGRRGDSRPGGLHGIVPGTQNGGDSSEDGTFLETVAASDNTQQNYPCHQKCREMGVCVTYTL